MAVLWQQQKHDIKYEIRTAGATRRLYKNGVCHSQYNPNRILTGSVWDLLFIPSLLFAQNSSLNVLVLGVGGGAAIRLYDYFLPETVIHGVELDAMHIELAQKFFGISQDNIHIHEADAKEWVKDYGGKPFDIVIEDVFMEEKKQPIRAIDATSHWYQDLLSLMKDDGMLIMNFASLKEFRQSSALRIKQLNQRFKSIFQLTTPSLDNVIGVYSLQTFQTQDLHNALMGCEQVRKAIETKYLRYRVRKLRNL